jgi:hypothetical protein
MSVLDSLIPRTVSPWKMDKKEAMEAGSPEKLLLDSVSRMDDFREGRVAAHIHLSQLQHHHRKEHYLRIACDTFELQVKAYAGHIFVLGTGDIFFVGKDVRMDSLIEAVDRLRLLFAEDPLAQYSRDGDQSGFATYYNLEENFDLLYQDVVILHKAADRQRKTRDDGKGKIGKESPGNKPFIPADLAKLISIIERADLSNIIRRQTACVMGENGLPAPLFEETFVSIDDLQQICTPDIDLLSDRWLFHYLTRTLDKRVLSTMLMDGIRDDLPFSINLNISTVLSPEFRRFNDNVPAHLRGKLVIEIHKVDVFSDIGAYIFARDFLHERGYRLLLDGLTHHTLPFFDSYKLGLDLFKIYWAPEGLNTAHPSTYPDIKQMIMEYEPKRTILCRCENEESLKVGRDLGITQFQGRMIDRLLLLSKTGNKRAY